MAQRTQAVKIAQARTLNQDPRKLRRRRVARGLSVSALSRRADVSMGTISNLERGTQSGQPRILAKLADALGCEVTDLLPDEPKGSAA